MIVLRQKNAPLRMNMKPKWRKPVECRL